MEEELKAALAQTIADFNNNRAQILQAAFSTGGQETVTKIEQEYDALRDAYFELLKRQLDKNNHLYEQLMLAAGTETGRLNTSIGQVSNINSIIDLTTSVVNLLGRIIIVLGL